MKKSIKILILSTIILTSLILEITGLSTDIGSYYAYVLKPLIWIFIGIICYFFFKDDVVANLKYKKEVNFCVIVATLIYFIIYFILGYIKGFAHNPYDSSLKGILLNLWTFVPILIVKEYARFYMINNCGKKRILIWALLISLLFVATDLNIYKFDTYFESRLSTLEFIMETFVPSLITNLFLTYISYFASYKTTIIYSLLPQLAMYVLPILPDIDWATTSILSAIIPFFTYIYVNYIINKMDKTLKRKDNKTVGLKGWIAMLCFVVLMILFGLGVFSVEPLVIASNSMYPKIKKGDIVIIKDTDVNDIKQGDIIRYRMDSYYVVHRVVSISKDEEGNLEFITKGDNNNDVDLYPVKQQQVSGVIKLDIPYAGYPTLILSELLNTNNSEKVTVDKGRID